MKLKMNAEDVKNVLKVVRTIRREIRQKIFENEYYPPSDKVLNNLDINIPKKPYYLQNLFYQ